MGNDMTEAQWVAHWPTIIPEPVAIWNARLSGYPDGMPTAFITMADDAGAPPELTKRSMANLGGDVDRRVVQGAHLAMITKPGELAGLINDIVNC
jgi:hypothetical protein